MDAENGAGSKKPDIIITIHGTGAGRLNPVNPHWESPNSRFAQELRNALGGKYRWAEPFCWNGNNYESDRRRAAARLLRRLRNEDAFGNRYHLIAHSHGGSIVWHALVGSVRIRRRQLEGLASWTTVGTPFLAFGPDYAAWWLPVVSALALAVCAGGGFLLREALLDREAILDDANPFALVGTLTLFGLVALTTTWLSIQSGLSVAHWIGAWADATGSQVAARLYRSRWLAIWHSEDEPIRGLAGTLVDPASLASRKIDGGRSSFRRWFVRSYNWLVATPLNQFAWSIIVSRLQGADILGLRMTEAAQCPQALRPGQRPLEDPVAGQMSQEVDRMAGESVGGFRKQLNLLAKLRTADEALARLARAITWRELIHTSYFNQPEIVRAIAAHVAGRAGRGQDSSPADAVVTYPRALHALAAAKAALAVLVLGSLSIGAFSAFNAAIEPYISSYQLTRIANAVASNVGLQPELVNLRYDSTPGRLLTRLYVLGRLSDPKSALERIANEDTRSRSAQRLAYSLGHASKTTELMQLVTDMPTIPGFEGTRVSAVVGLQGLAGALAADTEIDRSLVSKILDLVHDEDRGELQELLGQWIVPWLHARGLEDMVQRAGGDYADLADATCSAEKEVVIRSAKVGATDVVIKWIEKCKDANRVIEILDDAILEAYGTKHSAAAITLLRRRMQLRALSPPVVAIDTVNILLEAGQTADATGAAKMLLERWRTTKPRTGAREVLSMVSGLRAHDEGALAGDIAGILEHGIRERLTEEEDDREKISAAKELAFLLNLSGRRAEVSEMAAQSFSAGQAHSAERGYNAAVHFIVAGVMSAEIADKQSALDQLEEATRALSNYHPLEKRIALYDATIEALAPLDIRAARAAIEACTADIARLDVPVLRAQNFAGLARRYASIQDTYRARLIAERAASPEHVLGGYRDILDHMIDSEQPQSRQRFALDEGGAPPEYSIFSEALPPK
jgi:hypothetical protein